MQPLAMFEIWSSGGATCHFGIGLVSSSARVTSVKFQQHHFTELQRFGPIDETPDIPGSDKIYSRLIIWFVKLCKTIASLSANRDNTLLT